MNNIINIENLWKTITLSPMIRTWQGKDGNDYFVIKEVGRGSTGIVYLAHDIKHFRTVAIKQLTIDDSVNELAKERIIFNFKREAIALARLNHQNIVNVYDLAEQDNNYFIIMEYIEGISLAKILKLHPLPLDIALNTAIQVCDALAHLHKYGVIHRDIKPENIVLLGNGLAKLIDFTCSKFFSDSVEENSCILTGTFLYMSPEQLKNSDTVDEQADIYSMAVTLYEMLTGEVPFHDDSIGKVVMKILTNEPVLPSLLNPCLPKGLDAVIMKALSKNKDSRYRTISQFAAALKIFLTRRLPSRIPRLECLI
jgi:serine/threonine protein kinase